jgi:tetratricopeptide (TPR) repeat protein
MLQSSLRSCILAGVVLSVGQIGWGQELVKHSVPEKWLIELAPEKLPALRTPEYFDELDKVRQLAFHGRYKQALIDLARIDKKKADPASIALVKAMALGPIGRRDEAIETLSKPDIADVPKVQLAKAKLLSEIGHKEQAVALFKWVLQRVPDSLEAHYELGRVSEETGDIATAKHEYNWIHDKWWDKYQGMGAKSFEDAEPVTILGRAFDRWATLNGNYANNVPLHNAIFKIFVQAYDVVDRSYWPAHIAAAEYYISHGNPNEAKKELGAALKLNPNDIHTFELLGQIAIAEFNFDGADKAVEKIREVDENAIEADILDGRNFMNQRRPKEAEVAAKRVLAKQPKNLDALGILASSYAFQLKEQDLAAVLKDVQKIDPNNASVYLELAENLGAMRQYPRAEKMYQVAIDRAPWNSAARNGLGLLMTQSGDEDKAKVVLDAAYSLDPFNYRTINYLILLDKMAKMDKKESAHFVVFYDKADDPLVAEYFTDYLESIYKDVTGDFKAEPPVKTYIEVFPGHDAFSARITGAPWIGTVGASTGRVIALCTPRRGENTLGTYNWAQVLRHEFTHTVTLAATDNRIGHWFTEGLAVSEEHSPLRWEWVPMLYNAVKKHELFAMEDLTWAFVRPKKPMDRQLAYAQSFWICQYIEGKWGHDAILKMMEEFRKGKTQDDVFPAVLGVNLQTFSDGFFQWTEKQVSTWGYDEETTKKVADLEKEGQDQVRSESYDDAIKTWEEIAKLRPMDELPHQRLAGLYLATKNTPKAREQLIRLHDVSLKDNRFAKRIARMSLDANDPKEALKYATDAVYIDPYDPGAHELLLAVQEKEGNAAGVEREKRVIGELKAWMEQQKKKGDIEENPKQ